MDLSFKKLKCCFVNGFTADKSEILHPWNQRLDKIELIKKPQWFHSAAAIILLYEFPSMRPIESFYNAVLKSEKEYVEIAKDVLRSDPDGIFFLENLQAQKQKRLRIVDTHSEEAFVYKEGQIIEKYNFAEN